MFYYFGDMSIEFKLTAWESEFRHRVRPDARGGCARTPGSPQRPFPHAYQELVRIGIPLPSTSHPDQHRVIIDFDGRMRGVELYRKCQAILRQLPTSPSSVAPRSESEHDAIRRIGRYRQAMMRR